MFNILTLIFFSILVFGQEFTESQKQFINEENLLKNPGGENGRTDWTLTAGVLASESTILVSGKRSLKVTLSSQALSLHQDSTLYQSQFADGIQGLAMVRVKTSVSGIRVCSRQNGVITSNLCVNVQAGGKWGLYKVPFILGGTSNGISINSNSIALTGDVYVDDAFLGAVDLKQDVPIASFLGSLRHIGATNCQWSVTSTASYSNYAVDADCTTPTASSPSIKAPTTKIPALVIPAGSPLGNYQIVVKGGFNGSSTGNQCWWRLNDGTNSTSPFGATDIDTGVSSAPGATLNYNLTSSSSDTTIQFQAQSDASNCDIVNNRTWTELSFELYYIPSTGSSFYSSTNADTDWRNFSNVSAGTLITTFATASPVNPTYGTVARNVAQWKRQGSDLLVRWDYRQTTAGTSGSGTNGIYAFNIPSETGCTIDTTKAPGNTTVNITDNDGSVGTVDGTALTNQALSGGAYVIDSTRLKFVLTATSAGNAANAGILGPSFYSFIQTPLQFSLQARVPCLNWQNSNIIIGSFDGIEKCTNTLECTDTFSAKVSAAGVVSDENVNWISGNASLGGTSTYTVTFNTGIFTVAPNCVANVDTVAGNASVVLTSSVTASSAVFTTVNVNDLAVAKPFNIICQKQGVDYIGKTGKAVASDQSIATPGITKVKACYAGYGGASASLIAPSNCTTGACVETYDTCGVFSAPSFSTTGIYTNFTITNGSFSNSSMIECSCKAYDTANISRDCRTYSDTGDQTQATNSLGGYVGNIYTTQPQTTGNVAGNSYFQIKCEGQAP